MSDYQLSLAKRYTGSVQAAVLWLLLATVIACASIYGWYFYKTIPVEGQGLISLSDIQMVQEGDELHLQTNAQVKLSSTIQAGLDSGVSLTFVLSLRVLKPRSFLPDKTVLDLKRRYKLTYYELTRHYRVHAVEVDVSRNYRSLSSALTGLGQLGRITFALDEQQLQKIDHDGLVGSLNMSLSKSALPLPLQPIIRSSWTLVSEEYQWPVT